MNNRFRKIPDSLAHYYPVKMGSLEWEACVAKNIEFHSNDIGGSLFQINATPQAHSYSVFWTLTIHVTDKNGKISKNVIIRILDKNRKEVLLKKVPENGIVTQELMEYFVKDAEKTYLSPYTIIVGKKKKIIPLQKNTEITLVEK